MIFLSSAEKIRPCDLEGGFFEGWPNPPSAEAHLRILRGSSFVELAMDSGNVVGFVTAISDGVSCAYIPFLEVLPAYRDRGVGGELIRRLFDRLSHLYMIDLCCDEKLVPYYNRMGMIRGVGMLKRNYSRQNCEPIDSAE